VATWLANIRDAKAWMEQHVGCVQISLVGLRLGASLAVQIANEQAISNLVLWSPVVKGRMYVREMKALGLTAEVKPQPLPEAPEDIEAAGFIFTKETADALSQLDLLQSHPQCQRVLIMTRDDLVEDRRLFEHLATRVISVEQVVQPGYADMMAEPHLTKVPAQAIACTVDWLLARDTDGPLPGRQMKPRSAMPVEATMPHQQYTSKPANDKERIRERLLQFSKAPDLFGVLSEPETDSSDGRPLVLLVNAGATYRVGPSRLYVLLARELAVQGFRSVRMDLCGLGDSVTTNLDGENDPYAASAFRDIELALEYLQVHLGAKRVVLMGLCSGAYFAFQTAAQLRGPVLVESVLINPLTFYWKEGMTLEATPGRSPTDFYHYKNAALQPKKWLKMLAGRTKIGPVEALKIFVQHWWPRKPSAQGPLTLDRGESMEPGLSHPLVEDLSADLGRMGGAGRQLTCFFSASDPGYSIMMFHAKRAVNELRRAGKVQLYFIENADHTFSARVPRREVVRAIAAHLCARYPSSSE
jgi:pimeloyl-ACP methyl ester carboxylesterase